MTNPPFVVVDVETPGFGRRYRDVEAGVEQFFAAIGELAKAAFCD